MIPARIEVGPDRVVIEWEDDEVTTLAAAELRRRCPCAACRAAPPDGAGIAVVDARLVGGYGISFTFSDGHSAGIYDFASLRA